MKVNIFPIKLDTRLIIYMFRMFKYLDSRRKDRPGTYKTTQYPIPNVAFPDILQTLLNAPLPKQVELRR